MVEVPTDRPIRIIVVDDDRDMVSGFKTLLEEEGFEVHGEYNGKAALEELNAKSYEFAFIDGLLPNMDGFALCQEICWIKHQKDIQLIMISGIYRASNHAREAIEKYRLLDYIDKPITPVKIIKILKKVLGAKYPKAELVKQETQKITIFFNDYYLFDSSKMSLVGSLKTTPYPVLLGQIAERKLTGQVMFTWGKAKKVVSFSKGKPVASRSNIINECLGQHLLKESEILKEDMERSFEVVRKTGKRHGEVMLEMGLITSLQLTEALRLQFMNKIYSVFNWHEAKYTFKPKKTLPASDIQSEIHPYAFINDGLKRYTPLKQIEMWLKKYLTSPIFAASDCMDRMNAGGFNLKESRFACSLDASESLEDVLVNSLKTRNNMSVFVMALLSIGAIKLEQPEIIVDEEIEESLDDFEDTLEASTNVLRAKTKSLTDKSSSQIGSIKDVAMSSKAVKTMSVEDIEKIEMLQAMQRMDDEQKEIYRTLFVTRKNMRDKNYFEIFDADEETDKGEIKKTFLEMAKRFHPDTIASNDMPEIRKLADEVFTTVSKANEVLSNDKKRKEYIEFLKTGGDEDATEEIAKILAAEQHFHEGQNASRRKDWGSAKKYFQEAVNLHPKEGEFLAELGWSHFNHSPGDMVAKQEATKYLEDAIELSPKSPNAYFYLGIISKQTGELLKAVEWFLETLKVDKRHAKAKSEIHLLKMRRDKKRSQKTQKGGLFSFLNKKK